jgi:hypothetical protein
MRGGTIIQVAPSELIGLLVSLMPRNGCDFYGRMSYAHRLIRMVDCSGSTRAVREKLGVAERHNDRDPHVAAQNGLTTPVINPC